LKLQSQLASQESVWLTPGADDDPLSAAGLLANLQLLGQRPMQRMHAPTEVDLKDALQSLLFCTYGPLALFFENQMQRLVDRFTFLAANLHVLAKTDS
jgi:hypothetical protein